MFSGSKLSPQGLEIPDTRRPSVPSGWRPPEPLTELIQRMVRTELSRQAVDAGQESFEEADDFDVDEDPDDFISSYEIRDMVPEAGSADASPPGSKEKPVEAEAAAAAPAQADPQAQ